LAGFHHHFKNHPGQYCYHSSRWKWAWNQIDCHLYFDTCPTVETTPFKENPNKMHTMMHIMVTLLCIESAITIIVFASSLCRVVRVSTYSYWLHLFFFG
jgi:hypothetical protein